MFKWYCTKVIYNDKLPCTFVICMCYQKLVLPWARTSYTTAITVPLQAAICSWFALCDRNLSNFLLKLVMFVSPCGIGLMSLSLSNYMKIMGVWTTQCARWISLWNMTQNDFTSDDKRNVWEFGWQENESWKHIWRPKRLLVSSGRYTIITARYDPSHSLVHKNILKFLNKNRCTSSCSTKNPPSMSVF